MSFFLVAFVSSVIVVALVAAVFIFFAEEKTPVIVASVVALVLTMGWNWFALWKWQPTVGFNSATLYQNFWMWFVELVIVAIIIGAVDAFTADDFTVGTFVMAIALVVVLAFNGLVLVFSVGTDGRAKQLANYVHVVEEKAGSYPETDSNHIVVVPEQVARRSASNALNQGNGNLSTNYELLTPQLQSIKLEGAKTGHAYWVVAMTPAEWKTSNRLDEQGGVYVPGYVLVDAEDANVLPRVVTKTSDGKDINIRYTVGGSFDHKLDRFVWSHGYNGAVIDDWTLEVDDSLRPYWTATVNKLTLNYQATVPQDVMTVDPQTGEIKTYAFDEVPTWLDRIYSASTAKQMLDWWADYAQNDFGFFGAFRNATNRFKVSGEPSLVYTKEDYPVWQMELTSVNSDTSVSYIALFDGRWSRTGSPVDKDLRPTVRLYKVDSVALSSAVGDSIKGAPDNVKKYEATHTAIHKIDGVLTWVAPLVPEGQAGSGGSTTLQGVALVQADRQINGGDIVIGTTMADALNKYATVRSTTGSSKPSEDSSLKTVTGTIERVASPLNENGTTVYYFTLSGDTHVYRATFNPTAKDANLEVPFIKVGAKITISFRDNGTVRSDVVNYDDLGIKVG